MITVVDEVLAGEPTYKIINNETNEVLYANVSIVLATEVVTQGTLISKVIFDSIASDFAKIIDGTTIVKKAEQDKNGNDITTTYEKTENKETTLTEDSETKFPSSKAVAQYVATKIGTVSWDNVTDKPNIDTTISSASTDDNIPSSKAVFDYAEAKASKASVISSASTDEQYPSAKAVVDYVTTTVNTALGNIENSLAQI